MSFAERLAASTQFEAAVLERLNRTGWAAFPFGQGQLSHECRERLRVFEDLSGRPCLIRWMPDIIAFRSFPAGRSRVALIDAKACGDGPNISLEKAAIETCEIYTDRLYAPTIFVFGSAASQDGWGVMTPRDAHLRGRPGSDDSGGSGTLFVLVAKRFGRPFDDVFPPAHA